MHLLSLLCQPTGYFYLTQSLPSFILPLTTLSLSQCELRSIHTEKKIQKPFFQFHHLSNTLIHTSSMRCTIHRQKHTTTSVFPCTVFLHDVYYFFTCLPVKHTVNSIERNRNLLKSHTFYSHLTFYRVLYVVHTCV